MSTHPTGNTPIYSLLDKIIINLDQTLQTLAGNPIGTGRPCPAPKQSPDNPDQHLSKQKKQHAAALMRINQTGEIAAQALYQGQALTARDPNIQSIMQQAAIEENDHLRWCTDRVHSLNSPVSHCNPICNLEAFTLGLIAGLAGDKWSLGFLAETEKQVGAHLQKHLNELPRDDHISKAIVQQMWEDETKHAHMAIEQGGANLPAPFKIAMRLSAKIMTKIVYYL